jgi:Kef-type K+ transport system membrane component KefB
VLFLLQLCVIAAAAQVFGRLFHKIGQPRVVGEMAAGIALGPSLLGWIAPSAQQWLFPASSFALLNAIGQLGLVFYMFLVGMTLNVSELREQRRIAVASSVAGIAAPFLCGLAVAFSFYDRLSPLSVPEASFALFFAVSMSITAFPVLARILHETGLMETRLGSVAIASAAFGDVAAWVMLAAILALTAAVKTLGELAIYAAAMFVFRFVWPRASGKHALGPALVAALASSALTDWIGVHALFGAFFAGVMIPKTAEFIEDARRTVEPLTAFLFLPVFFACTGLRTRFGLIFSRDLLFYTLVILAVAVAGKWLGAMFAARAMGMPGREANALGVLMNTRGLVELVVLSIGFDLGLITSQVFSMMVMMALVTTLMTAPLVRRIYPTNASASISTSMSGSISRET